MTLADMRLKFSPKNLVAYEKVEGAYTFYSIAPSVMYPPALLDLILRGEITREDAELAVTPRYMVTSPNTLLLRAETLEKARKHFLLTLLHELGNGTSIHILKDEDWRL